MLHSAFLRRKLDEGKRGSQARPSPRSTEDAAEVAEVAWMMDESSGAAKRTSDGKGGGVVAEIDGVGGG